MPLSGGTSGAHDDSMHQGSAKRDVVGGVGGLDASGFLLAKGAGILFPRTGSDDVHIYERTSGEEAYAFHRTGADDYTFYIKESNVWKRFQTESMKDVANGIAALDAAGDILALGEGLRLTRRGDDKILIYERTSTEYVMSLLRVGLNNYQGFINSAGAGSEIQLANMKDVANGIAGLDANTLLSPVLLPPCLEKYSNHLGAVDNFTETVTAGNGTANTDAANHEMDISSGLSVVGHTVYQTKDAWSLGAKPMISNHIVRNPLGGSLSKYKAYHGFKSDFTSYASNTQACFYEDHNGNWFVSTANAGAETTTAITYLSDGDILSIFATSSRIMYFVNGVLVATHTTNIPTSALHFGSSIIAYASGAANARSISIDYISMRRYV